MVSRSLIRHWTGMAEDEITSRWEAVQKAKFDEIMESEQRKLEEAIVENIGALAKKGDIAAYEWLEARGLINEEGRRSDQFIMLQAIANRARGGALEAVEWLEKRGRVNLPGKA